MRGFKAAEHPTARFEPVGSIDVDPGACRNYRRLVGSEQSCLDLFSLEQFLDYHSQCVGSAKRCPHCHNTGRPPEGWTEVTLDQFRAAFGDLPPNVMAMSSPCQGASGMLSDKKAETPRYRALNAQTVRGVFLTLEAWKHDPPDFIIFENVPRIRTRGRPLLVQIVAMLDYYGYATQETVHDCGELGSLAQHRQRFFMVARHREKVRPFLYVPPKRRVRAIREVLWDKPLPGDTVRGGKMHGMIKAQWKTWVRLALIPAGKDWRALKDQVGKWVIVPAQAHRAPATGTVTVDVPHMGQHKHMRMYSDAAPAGTVTGTNDIRSGSLLVADERMAQIAAPVYRVEPAEDREPYPVDGPLATGGRRGHNNVFVVLSAEDAAKAINGGGGPSSGAPSVADDRLVGGGGGSFHGKLRVEDALGPAHTVTGSDRLGSGAPSVTDGRLADLVADPRPIEWGDYHAYGVKSGDEPSGTVTSKAAPGSGDFSVADPRPADEYRRGTFGVIDGDAPAPTVTTRGAPSTGRFSLADDRIVMGLDEGKPFLTQSHYGVRDASKPSGAVTASGKYDNGPWTVADDRVDADDGFPPAPVDLPAPDAVLDPWPIIIAPDGTVHRPMTTAELAWLQGLPLHLEDGSVLELDGNSSSEWRRWIGNMWPPPAAQAVGESMLRTLELERQGVSFSLSPDPVWVRQQDLRVSDDDAEWARWITRRLRNQYA